MEPKPPPPQAAAPARSEPWLIVLAASVGGVQALRTIIAALPADFSAALVIVQHRPPQRQSELADILRYVAHMPVVEPQDLQPIQPGVIYLARPDAHLTVTHRQQFLHRDGSRIRFSRSSANPLFESAADVFGKHVVAVVLTGTGSDATDGVQAVRKHGGYVIAQDKLTAEQWGMPGAAVASGVVDYVLPLTAIAPAIQAIVSGTPMVDVPAGTD